MRYLGALHGAGMLSLGEESLGRASYDFDGYVSRPGEVTSSGEIRTTRKALKSMFGMKGLRLVTDDGRTLSLRFTEKALRPDSISAHVDVMGDLPSEHDWTS